MFSFSASQALVAGQVPAPAAVWLMGIGLPGMVGMAPHKKAAYNHIAALGIEYQYILIRRSWPVIPVCNNTDWKFCPGL
jgi:hypothetical protein